MKIMLDRKTIKDAVAGLTRVVSKRTSLPILGCVRIASEDAGCTMTATDLDQTLAFKCKSSAFESGTVIVPFDTLNLLTRGPDAEPVTFESGRKKELTILNTVAGQEIGRTFEVADPDEWPGPTPAADVGPVDPAFLANFRRASLFASDDQSRVILNGVCLHVDEKAGDYLVTTDGRRMGAFNTIKLPLRESCVVPASRFMLWSKLVPDELLIGSKQEKESGWFRLVTAQWDYRCRTQPGTYPNWRMVVPGEDGAHQFNLSETDAELLKKILPTFAGHDAHNQPVKFDLRDSRTFIVGRGEDDKQPSRLELTDTRSIGPAGEISVDRKYLLDALTAGFRVFRFEDERSPLTSRSEDGGIHVVMPLRSGTTPSKPEPATNVTQVASDPASTPATAPVAPAAAQPQAQPEQKEKRMSKTDTTAAPATEPSALDRVLAAYETAKAKVREANEALAMIAAAVKDAAKEDKARRQEVESVRSGLAKLQAIKV